MQYHLVRQGSVGVDHVVFRPVGCLVIEPMLDHLLNLVRQFAESCFDFVRPGEYMTLRHQLLHFQKRQERFDRLPEPQWVNERQFQLSWWQSGQQPQQKMMRQTPLRRVGFRQNKGARKGERNDIRYKAGRLLERDLLRTKNKTCWRFGRRWNTALD